MALSIPLITEYSGKGLDKFRKELAQAETATQKAGLVLKKAFVPATAAIAALAAGLADATKAAIEDAASAQLLAANLRRTTGATDDVIAATEDWIATQGQLLGVADDDLRPALSRLARVTGDVTKAQKIVTQAMDISAATGKPLESVVQSLERAYAGNMIALQRLLPEYRTMIKEGASFEDIMANIATVTGGAATDAANTAEGQFKRLSLAFNETKESIGAALLPVIEAVLPYLQRFAAWAQNNPQAFLAVAGAIGAVAGSIVAVNIAMALNPFALIAGGIVALGAALVVAYNKFEGFRNIVNAVFGALKAGVSLAIDNFFMLLNVWKTIFNGIATAWNKTLGTLSINIPDIPGLPGRGKSFGIPKVPLLADGGIIKASPGGTLAVIGEGGQDEAVIPLNRLGAMTGGGGVTINVHGGDPQAVVDALRTYMYQNGTIPIRVSG